MKVVGKYTSAFAANVAKGMLENEGIPAMVLNQNAAYITGVANTDLISIELAVPDDQYEQAVKLLNESVSLEE